MTNKCPVCNLLVVSVDISSGHHTKKTEKQFAAGPGRKSITQQSLPLVYEESDASYTEASYDRELQQDVIQEPAMMPTGSTGKKKRKATKAAPSHYDIKTRPKRSAAATKSPLKFGIYVDEIDDMELSDNEQEQIKSAAATVTEPSSEDSQVKYTEIVPVSGPIPVVPKLNTEDSFQTEEFSEGSATFSGAMGEFANVENIVVKKEAESDIEAGVVMEEEDPDWKPGTKKRRKSSGSRSVSSPVNASGDQAQSK